MKNVDEIYELETDRIHEEQYLHIVPCKLCEKFQLLDHCVGTHLDEGFVFCSIECAESWERENGFDYIEVQEKPTKEELDND